MKPLLVAVRTLLIVVLVVVVWASLKPTGSTIAGSDKIAHFLAYAALSGLGLLSFGRVWFQAGFVVFCLLLGGTMEIMQGMLPHRVMGWDDMLANALGVAVAVAVYWPLRSWFDRLLGKW